MRSAMTETIFVIMSN